jgi:hypothetical protein
VSTQAFQLDPSLAGLSPAILKKRYDQLTPEERRALGFTRLATDQEAANAPQPASGAPADFGGAVLPNPNGIKVSDDTEPGGEPTRLPDGVTFQKQNFSGAMPGDVSNPPRAAIVGQTAASHSVDYDALAAQHGAQSGAVDYDSIAQQHGGQTDAAPEPSGFWDTLQREGKSAVGSIAGVPAAVYHAFAEPPTQEEKDRFGGEDEVAGAKRIGLGIHRLTTAPLETAVNWYSDVAKGKVPDAYEQALSVAPEAIGSAAGNVLGGKLTEGAIKAAPAVADAAAPAVRATARGVNKALEKAPGTIGTAAGAAIGAASRVPYGFEIGGYLGGTVGSELLPQLKIPGEHFGLPDSVEGGPAAAPSYVEKPPAVTPSEAEEFEGVPSAQTQHAGETIEREPETEAAAPETPATTLTKKASPADLEKALNDALGGKPLQKGIPLKNQNQSAAPAAAAKLPEGFTPVDSSLLQGYKYDPEAREFSAILKNGQSYVHGDVSPEAAKAFEDADSQGSAWTKKIRQGPGHVLIEKNGEPVVPGTMTSSTGDVIGKTQAGMEGMDPALAQKVNNLKDFMKQSPGKATATPAAKVSAPAATDDLTSLLQQSLDQAPGKGGVFTSVEPKALLDRWGVDPDTFATGREQTRGLSPQDSAASIKKLTAAYKKGQAVEPVLETRDADNNIIDVDGRGRALAAHKAGIERIPIIVRRMQ